MWGCAYNTCIHVVYGLVLHKIMIIIIVQPSWCHKSPWRVSATHGRFLNRERGDNEVVASS
ncbi:hypothetical protein BDN70DRAFT_688952 [Pholiota conissans]|uniref:Uncharacterized protein n=1 Tax=Pholiota conissans TaxID=109636 RepID=A0A9P6CTM1_9AGAR|nr:hypothetical protein BDN70DRAFT_688952 [Pholiota conissans]